MKLFWEKERESIYRGPGKSMQIVLSNTQAGPGRTVKQEQQEISRNHVHTFSGGPVQSEASGHSLGLKDTNLGSSPGQLGQ